MLPARIHRAIETPANASDSRNLYRTRAGPNVEITLNVAPPIPIGTSQYRTSRRMDPYATRARVASRGGLSLPRTRYKPRPTGARFRTPQRPKGPCQPNAEPRTAPLPIPRITPASPKELWNPIARSSSRPEKARPIQLIPTGG